jgi:hypothetical protein
MPQMFICFGFILAVFLFWRSLKEDFEQEEVLTLAILTSVLGILGFWGLSVLGAFSAIILVFLLWVRKKAWDIWVVAEASTVPLLLFFIFGKVGVFLAGQDWFFLLQAATAFGVLVLVKKVLVGYRSFAFYKSGKVGFIFLSSLALFFSLLLALAILGGRVLKWEMLAQTLLILGAVGLLIKRAKV